MTDSAYNIRDCRWLGAGKDACSQHKASDGRLPAAATKQTARIGLRRHLVQVQAQHASSIRVAFSRRALLRSAVQVSNAANNTAPAQTERDEESYGLGYAENQADGLSRVLLFRTLPRQRVFAEPLYGLLVL